MFNALTVTSTKQGLAFDAAESARAYAVVERIAAVVIAVLGIAQKIALGSKRLRLVRI